MTTYYVATTGSGGGNGSASSPFRTISDAMASDLKPGDEVVVRAGTYNESVNMYKDGSAAGYITLRSEVPGGAVIHSASGGANGINITANYVAVEGFEVYGSDSHGIVGDGVHHVKIANNVSHDNGASGIAFAGSDFITIEGNETYKNASAGWFSGISLYQNRNITGAPDDGSFRNIIRNNISHDNVTKSGAHTDGNGIIIDDFQSTQTSGHPNYTFKTLVDNNLVYENGSKGIQVTWSDSVTVKNNTAYHNNQDLLNDGTWRGELSNAQSSNNTWINNIAVADPSVNKNNTAVDNTSYGGYTNANVVWANNNTYNGTAGQASVNTDGGNAMPSTANGNKLGIDPKFLGAASDNFHLGSGSAAIDGGTAKYGVGSVDLDGHARVVGTVDMGAYESGSSSTPGTPTTPTQPTTPTTPTEPTTPTTPTQPTTPTTPTQPTTPTAPIKEFIGTSGNDILPHTGQSNGGNETFKGLGGSDVLKGGAGADVLDGGTGNDTASYAGSDAVNVNLATKVASGGQATGDKIASIENLTGSSYNDVLTGGNGGGNVLTGGAGADKLDGGAGNDFLIGGAGKDIMTGGTGEDTFILKAPTETGSGLNRDVITDFQHGIDKIDLSAIDANGSAAGNGTFHFQAQENALFDHKAGALAWHYDDQSGTANDVTVIQADTNGDGVHDFEVQLKGLVHLGAGDFLL
ncbi:RTX toxin [Rhizobium leguminosarum bv. trifolii CB782]|uniref:choice-of-anchor Q domain-containing protein n=1 Tax=Rhizobium hidalgonense TaxID=1538159 RepID=UPI00027D2EA7|nr:choice-of-anchor Q domain-containing protein [Rhizobium hidalgonense]AHG45232.1 RTX toxin [Rhizobium leguminosarum bv. trifolii CB782]EJC72818.1 putative calcium-binding protein [Rhizobium leguminosarum bv. trifolii WSM2012]MDR9805289.1 right-handed parallel beta-helix repeat-containing protein [Rhizobium hidalgonense]QKK23938.1 right-handed parallel beta-helix repeat-containing protein [Rhizobium hidalgonense]RWX11378.1 RTX toxin [Rhizobium hidalgonense]